MILGAILVVGSKLLGTSSSIGIPQHEITPLTDARLDSVAHLEVLGRSILHRTISNLERIGIHAISIVADSRTSTTDSTPSVPAEIIRVGGKWEAEDVIGEKLAAYAGNGIRNILFIEVEQYMEFAFADVLEFHKDHGGVATRLRDQKGSLNAWIIDGVRAQRTVLPLFELLKPALAQRPYRLRGYVNRIRSAHDLRGLVTDAFDGRCAMRPMGTEVRPRVWIDEGASVHRLARVVAPAYIGKDTVVKAGTLVTRGSAIERDCILDCGTVIENSVVVAGTYLGKGLDVAHAVIDGSRFVHLKRNIALEVTDSKMIAAIRPGGRGTLWVDPLFVSPGNGLQGNTGVAFPAHNA